jgi:uncharacterized SAM-binding protein YcdF (DUF218 family)
VVDDRADALVVLGCRVGPEGLSPAAARRVAAAVAAWREGLAPVVVASGGRSWGGVVEADAMGAALVREGLPEDALILERCSFTTRENARYTARILARRGVARVAVVSCEWHLPRALPHFRDLGLEARGVPAPLPPDAGAPRRAWLRVREEVASWLERLEADGRIA